MRGIKFYSAINLDCGYELNKIEAAIESYDINRSNYEINEILEIYNIIKYIDKELYLPSWNEEFIKKLKVFNKVFKAIVGRLASQLNDENIIITYMIIISNFSRGNLYIRNTPSGINKLQVQVM